MIELRDVNSRTARSFFLSFEWLTWINRDQDFFFEGRSTIARARTVHAWNYSLNGFSRPLFPFSCAPEHFHWKSGSVFEKTEAIVVQFLSHTKLITTYAKPWNNINLHLLIIWKLDFSVPNSVNADLIS